MNKRRKNSSYLKLIITRAPLIATTAPNTKSRFENFISEKNLIEKKKKGKNKLNFSQKKSA